MPDEKKPNNPFGSVAGLLAFLAIVCYVFCIWTTDTTQHNWLYTGLFFTLVAAGFAVPAARWQRRQ